MNDTKQKILTQSLNLFNDYGISNVSLRTITDALGISVGNLQYHFKKREDIIEGLYFQIVEKIDKVTFVKSDNLLESFFTISTEMLKIFYEYHFFLLDFVAIVRNNQKIKKHYAKLSKQREKEFFRIVDRLIENDIFRKEILKNEYHNLYKRTKVVSNFWFSSVLIQNDNLSQKSIKEYSLLISQSVYPYLTKKAKVQYHSIFPTQLV